MPVIIINNQMFAIYDQRVTIRRKIGKMNKNHNKKPLLQKKKTRNVIKKNTYNFQRKSKYNTRLYLINRDPNYLELQGKQTELEKSNKKINCY